MNNFNMLLWTQVKRRGKGEMTWRLAARDFRREILALVMVAKIVTKDSRAIGDGHAGQWGRSHKVRW